MKHAEALVKRLGIQPTASDRLLAIMQRAFPHAGVTGHEHLVDDLDLPDPDDRHVLAAAMHGECDLLVTDNTRDFPEKVADDADVLVITTDDALVPIAERQPNAINDIVSAQVAVLGRPPLTAEAFVDRLAQRAPNAAMTIGATLNIAKYQRILDDTRYARGDRRPQGARRLIDAIGDERHEDVVGLVDQQLAAKLTGMTQPTPQRLHAALTDALHDVFTTDGWASRPRGVSMHPTANWSNSSAAAAKPHRPWTTIRTRPPVLRALNRQPLDARGSRRPGSGPASHGSPVAMLDR